MDVIDDVRKEYELAFMLALPEEEAELEKALLEAKVEIRARRPLAAVRLAYPIKKQNTAHFGAWKFVALPNSVQAIRLSLGLRSKVIRFLITAVAPERQVPAPVKPEVKEAATPAKPTKARARVKPQVLSNEALEEKLVEILK